RHAAAMRRPTLGAARGKHGGEDRKEGEPGEARHGMHGLSSWGSWDGRHGVFTCGSKRRTIYIQAWMYVKEAAAMARRTRKEALETRDRIIDAAEHVFQRKGVAHASLAEVAARAKVTRGAVYWHFKDKSELFDAMME